MLPLLILKLRVIDLFLGTLLLLLSTVGLLAEPLLLTLALLIGQMAQAVLLDSAGVVFGK